MDDIEFMKIALRLAGEAGMAGEVPVGAVLVSGEGKIICSGANEKEKFADPTCHAEMNVLRAAVREVGKYLSGCTLYVTLEPCAMCAGAMVNTRLTRLVFGAADPKGGAAGSVLNVTNCKALNHRVQVEGGVMATECAQILTQFFQKRRGEKE